MKTKRSVAEIRKQLIPKALLNASACNDFKRPDMAKVALRFGVAPSTIGRYFNHKQDTLDSVLHVVHSKLLDNFKAVYEETSDPLKQLELILTRHAELIRNNPSIPRVMLSDDVFIDSPEKKVKVQEIATDYVAKLREIVSQCQVNNKLHSDIDADTVSLMLLGTIQLEVLLVHFSSGGADVFELEQKSAGIE